MKKLKEISKEELELMSYDDIAYIILEEKNKKMKINELFKKVCDAKGLSEEEMLDRITNFFEVLTTDKRFIQLSDGYWDLKTNHSEKVIIEDEEEELDEEVIEQQETETDNEEDNFYDENEDDERDEDLKDLVIIDEDEDDNAM